LNLLFKKLRTQLKTLKKQAKIHNNFARNILLIRNMMMHYELKLIVMCDRKTFCFLALRQFLKTLRPAL